MRPRLRVAAKDAQEGEGQVSVESDRRAVAREGPYRVESLANDTYLVKPRRDGRGLLSRMSLAASIQAVLNARKRTK